MVSLNSDESALWIRNKNLEIEISNGYSHVWKPVSKNLEMVSMALRLGES
jgi:hypothetical protein